MKNIILPFLLVVIFVAFSVYFSYLEVERHEAKLLKYHTSTEIPTTTYAQFVIESRAAAADSMYWFCDRSYNYHIKKTENFVDSAHKYAGTGKFARFADSAVYNLGMAKTYAHIQDILNESARNYKWK